MKHNRGKWEILFLIFFSITRVFGDGFDYHISADTTNPYVKQPVIVDIDIQRTDASKVMLFHFEPIKSEDYRAMRLETHEKDIYQNAKIHYTYILFPLKAGSIEVAFNLTQKVTTAENVANSFVGERDNVKPIITKDTQIQIEPLRLEVKPLPKGTQLVGDFTMGSTFKNHQAKAYEPLNATITLKGTGYYDPTIIQTLIPANNAYTLFQGKPQVDRQYTDKGTRFGVVYPFALSAKESFTLPQIILKAFDPVNEKSYTLSIPQHAFTIDAPDPKTLIDTTDSPAPLIPTDWSWLGTLLGHIVVFAAGFLTAKSVQWQKQVHTVKESPFLAQVAQTNDPKILLSLLIAQNSKKYTSAIEKLEAHLYEGTKLNLNEIKRELHD